MTIHDTERKPGPREEVARALCNRRVPKPFGGLDAWDNLQTWAAKDARDGSDDLSTRNEVDAYLADADAAIASLKSYLLPQFFEAIEAEKEAGKTG
jgi:hypothetical protein